MCVLPFHGSATTAVASGHRADAVVLVLVSDLVRKFV
jgi:hypothetical protein